MRKLKETGTSIRWSKTLLLTMLVAFAVSVSACGDDEDEQTPTPAPVLSSCYCTAIFDVVDFPLYTEDSPTITDFEGECSDVLWTDLADEWQEYQYEGITLSCVETLD
ncbi:MAG: hypothetical protein LBR17_05680 [Bacteroidales bacterium]|jgi:hypothetical protein|nr:hypothetical protein [Bacteroidales bacterium]